MFAVLQLVPVAYLLVAGSEVSVLLAPLAVLLVISAVAPVRRPSARGFQVS